MTDKQIADALDVSPATVNHHWRHILVKLGVHGRAAAVACLLREASPSPKQAVDAWRTSL
jgi:DNA-binding CsgD family transcriptional regulator